MFKKYIEKLVLKAVGNYYFWLLLRPLIYASNYINSKRKKVILKNNNWTKYNSIFSSLEVKNGPFKGMKYPDYKAVGSSMYPKLLGSYEHELHDIVCKLMKSNYSELIDVGCAEGYYAIGFALKMEDLSVFAYDIDDQARLLCQQMSNLNNVTNRVTIGSFFDENMLANFKFSGRGLVICDTEGFESELFTSQSIKNLVNCDILIETHDFKKLGISSDLTKLFNNTHNISVIQSIDDIQKVKYYEYPELSSLGLDEKKIILSENRPSIMEWLFLESKNPKFKF